MNIELTTEQQALQRQVREYMTTVMTPELLEEMKNPEYKEGGGPEFRRAGIHQFIYGPDAQVFACPFHLFFRTADEMGDLDVGEPEGLGPGQLVDGEGE